jgi:hypothetical protein
MSTPDSKRNGGSDEASPSSPIRSNGDAALARIGEALRGLRFGSVLAVVQDGVVIQIERTEKTRLDKPPVTEQRSR